MSIEIKKLDVEYLNMVDSFLKKQESFVRIDGEQDLNPVKHVSSRTKKMYGAFENDELISMLGCLISTKDNSYAIVGMKTLPGRFKYLNLITSGLGLLWEKIISEREAEGYYTFYLLHNKKRWPINRMGKMWLAGIPSFKKYYGTIHAIIPAKTKPMFDLHWTLMGERMWDDDMVLEKRALKNIYHPSQYKIHNVMTQEEIDFDKL